MIGDEATVGADCILHAHVSIRERCAIGARKGRIPGTALFVREERFGTGLLPTRCFGQGSCGGGGVSSTREREGNVDERLWRHREGPTEGAIDELGGGAPRRSTCVKERAMRCAP